MRKGHSITKVGWGFGRCNQQCKHCYNSSKSDAPTYAFLELKTVADKICPDITDINFGTGEFAVNPRAVDIAQYINENYPKINLALTTTGSSVAILPRSLTKKLFHDVDVSVDFPDKKRHNEFRRHPEAWSWVKKALDILVSEEIPRSIVTCITSETTNDDIENLLNLARSYDATWRINWFRHTGRGTADLRVQANRAWEIISFLSDQVTFYCLDSVFAGPLNVECSPCPAGRSTCRIHENMETSCYPFLKGREWSGGNILNDNVKLTTIYDAPVFKKLRNRTVPHCNSCPFWEKCHGGCVTRAVLHNGGINEPDDYCPFKAGLTIEKLAAISIKKQKGDLVHDGYLCTTIVKPE